MLYFFILFFSAIICLPVTDGIKNYAPKLFNKFENFIDRGTGAKIITFFLLLLLGIEGGLSVYKGGYIEYDAELASLIVSWLYSNGHQIYQNLDGPEVYSILYGPIMYIPAALIFKAGGWMNEARLIGVSGIVVFFASSWIVIKDQKYRFEILLWLAVSIYMTLYFVFCTQLNSWLIALPVIGVIGATTGRLWVIAIVAGISVGIKITSILYFAPIIIWVLLDRKIQIKEAIVAVIIFIATVAAPFGLPGVDLNGFIFWIKAASLHKKIAVSFWINLSILVTLCAPVIVLLWEKRRHLSDIKSPALTFVATFVSGTIVCYLASKEGSGSYHLIPFVGSILLTIHTRKDWTASTGAVFAFLFFSLFAPISFLQHSQFLSLHIVEMNGVMKSKTNDAVVSEMNSIIKDKGDVLSFSMGSGKLSHHQNSAILELLKAGGTYVLSDVNYTDWKASGISLPKSTLDIFKNCGVKNWLIPSGNDPFVSTVSYRANEPLFEDISALFPMYYKKEVSGKYFDLWTCSR